MGVDGGDVGAEVEDAADAGDDGGKSADFGEADGDGEAVVAGEMRDFDAAGFAVDLDGARVGVLSDDFEAFDRAGAEEGEHRAPVVGCPIAEAQCDVGFRGGEFAPAEGAGWALEEVEEGFVEAADAAESGGGGDLRHGHVGFVEEVLGEEYAAGLSDGDGRRS